VLDRAFIQVLAPNAPRYVVYADSCLLSEAQRASRGVVFRKIPRDIVRF
jgi:adenine-specific DNA-methyltransferase